MLLIGYARVRGLVVPRLSVQDPLWLTAVAATGMAAFNVLLIRATEPHDPADG